MLTIIERINQDPFMFWTGIGILIVLHIAVFSRMWRDAKCKNRPPPKSTPHHEQKDA